MKKTLNYTGFKPGMIDLGWSNEWKETPDLVKKCHEDQRQGNTHTVKNVDIGPPRRGMEHVVTCQECNYVYRYDSSD